MNILDQITKDRENLVEGLQRMLVQVEQQKGAVQYCDSILERVKAQNGAATVVEAAPVEGEID